MCKAMTTIRELPFTMRDLFWAISIVLLLGSLCALPFPAVAYPINARWLLKEGFDIASANAAMRESAADGGMRLFAGITLHSQMLAPMLSLVFAFLLCDMLFVEHRMCKWHLVFIGMSVIFAYMTQSRTAFVAIIVTIVMCSLIVFNVINLPSRFIHRLKIMFVVLFVMVVIAGVVAEIKYNVISSWIYKGVDKEEDYLVAMTASRMGAVEMMLDDFKRNPLIGCGFQVNQESARFADQTFVFSAPVEKGVTPLVVLSEGGIIGSIIFIGFLLSFYATFFKNKYYSTLVLFTTFLAVNLGEAILFSPGGVGGFLWGLALIGGLSLDLSRQNLANISLKESYAYRLD